MSATWLLGVLALAEGAVRLSAVAVGREREIGTPRPGAHVVYCIGDSFTYGQGVRPEEAWPSVLAGMLGDVPGADGLVIPVLAEPGRSSSVVVRLVADALAAGDARLILVLTGWNANDGDFAAYTDERHRPIPWTTRLNDWLEHSRFYKLAKHLLTLRSRTLVFDDVEIVPQTTAMLLYDFRAYQ